MVDVAVFVASLLVTIVALIWGFIYLRSRLQSFSRLPKELSSVRNAITDDQEESADEDAKPGCSPNEDPAKSQALWSSRRSTGDVLDCDPMNYCDHIQREMKRTKHRVAMEKIEAEMTEQQKEEERQTQRRQIEEIFRLMEDNKDEFGLSSVDEIQEQMKLYIDI